MVRYSKSSESVSAAGADVWDDHFAATARKAAGEDVILMSVGDPDIDTPPPIIDAAIAALNAGDKHHNSSQGRSRIRIAVADKLRAMLDVPYDADQIVITLDCQNALLAAATLKQVQEDVFASLYDQQRLDRYNRLRRPVVEKVVSQIKRAMGPPRPATVAGRIVRTAPWLVPVAVGLVRRPAQRWLLGLDHELGL